MRTLNPFTENAQNPSTRRRRLMLGAMLLACLTMFEPAQSSTPQWPPPEPVQQRLDAALELLDDLHELAPEYSDDLNDMALAMEFDIEQAIAHVSDEIRFVPYQGLLRGVDGTAATGGGNAWDQALLLASLIKTIGADAQVVAGTITNDDAQRLLIQAFNDNQESSAILSQIDAEAILKRIAEYDSALASELKQTPNASQSETAQEKLREQTDAMTDRLLRLLADNDIQLDRKQSVDSLIESLATNYAWVQWRMGPGSEWQALHPAFAGDETPTVAPNQYFNDEIPVEHQHRIAFELFIERTTANKSERVAVMQRFERPTAQLYKNQLTLGMGPLPNSHVDSGAILVPLLNGKLAPGAHAVTEMGLTASASDAASAAGQLFATVSSRMGDALGALDEATGSEPDRVPRLTGIVLNVEMIQPGQEKILIERRMIDLRQFNETESLSFPESATFGLVIDTDIGAVDDALINQTMLSQNRKFLQALPAFIASARGVLPMDQMQNSSALRQLGPAKWLDYELYSSIFLPAPSATQVSFRTGAMLASRRTVHAPDQNGEKKLLTVSDILTNPAQSLQKDTNGEITVHPKNVLIQGIRETLLESEMAASNNGWDTRVPNRLVEDSNALNQLASQANWPVAAIEMAAQDLNRGYLLGVIDTSEPYWWRVQPDTGQTLGMNQYGGSEATFYITLVGGAAISTLFFYSSVQECDETFPNNREMADCCIVGNLVATYTTSVVSGGVTNWFSNFFSAITGKIGRALAFETLTNYTVGKVTGGPIESVCKA